MLVLKRNRVCAWELHVLRKSKPLQRPRYLSHLLWEVAVRRLSFLAHAVQRLKRLHEVVLNLGFHLVE